MSRISQMSRPDGPRRVHRSHAEREIVEREPEIQLWRSVILRAVLDACGCTDCVKICEPGLRRYERESAKAWFEQADAYFEAVCDFAELPHRDVQAGALSMVARFEPVLQKHGRVNKATILTELGLSLRCVNGTPLEA